MMLKRTIGLLFSFIAVSTWVCACAEDDEGSHSSNTQTQNNCRQACAPDQYCGQNGQCLDKIEAGLSCTAHDACKSNVCYSGTCTCDSNNACPDGSHCTSTTGSYKICSPKKESGESCTANSECSTGLCQDGVCGCATDDQCPSGYYCGDDKQCSNENVVTCPNDKSQKCRVLVDITPNSKWYYGKFSQNQTGDNDIYTGDMEISMPDVASNIHYCASAINILGTKNFTSVTVKEAFNVLSKQEINNDGTFGVTNTHWNNYIGAIVYDYDEKDGEHLLVKKTNDGEYVLDTNSVAFTCLNTTKYLSMTIRNLKTAMENMSDDMKCFKCINLVKNGTTFEIDSQTCEKDLKCETDFTNKFKNLDWNVSDQCIGAYMETKTFKDENSKRDYYSKYIYSLSDINISELDGQYDYAKLSISTLNYVSTAFDKLQTFLVDTRIRSRKTLGCVEFPIQNEFTFGFNYSDNSRYKGKKFMVGFNIQDANLLNYNDKYILYAYPQYSKDSNKDGSDVSQQVMSREMNATYTIVYDPEKSTSNDYRIAWYSDYFSNAPLVCSELLISQGKCGSSATITVNNKNCKVNTDDEGNHITTCDDTCECEGDDKNKFPKQTLSISGCTSSNIDKVTNKECDIYTPIVLSNIKVYVPID